MDVTVLEASLTIIEPKKEAFVDLYFRNLFQTFPAFSTAFANISEKKRKEDLWNILTACIECLRQNKPFNEQFRDFAQTSYEYGIREIHYDVSIEVFLQTLKEMLGKKYTPAMREEWCAALKFMKKRCLVYIA